MDNKFFGLLKGECKKVCVCVGCEKIWIETEYDYSCPWSKCDHCHKYGCYNCVEFSFDIQHNGSYSCKKCINEFLAV